MIFPRIDGLDLSKPKTSAETASANTNNSRQIVSMVGLAVLAVILGVVMAGVIALWQGYVLAILWNWFITPFFGIAALTVPLAVGILFTFRFCIALWAINQNREEDQTKAVWKPVVTAIIAPAVYLFLGWITTFFL
jgi:hypothetical protein